MLRLALLFFSLFSTTVIDTCNGVLSQVLDALRMFVAGMLSPFGLKCNLLPFNCYPASILGWPTNAIFSIEHVSHKSRLVFIVLLSRSSPRAMRPDIHALILVDPVDLAMLKMACDICTSV